MIPITDILTSSFFCVNFVLHKKILHNFHDIETLEIYYLHTYFQMGSEDVRSIRERGAVPAVIPELVLAFGYAQTSALCNALMKRCP